MLSTQYHPTSAPFPSSSSTDHTPFQSTQGPNPAFLIRPNPTVLINPIEF